jgi:uncharacterized protein YjeT (DUF2065 family)
MRPLAIFSFFVAALCFSSVAFSAAFLAPKIGWMLTHLETPFPLLSESYQGFTWDKRGLYLAIAGLMFALAGLCSAMVPGIWKRLSPKLASITGVSLSLGSLAWLVWESITLFMGATDIIFAGDRKTQSYRRVLEEFTLVEAAEGRIAATNERIRALLNFTPQPIQDLSLISRSDAESRLNQLLRLIDTNQSPALAKQALATMPLFAELLTEGNRKSRMLLESANRITGRHFGKVDDLFEWVKTQEGNGYIPITLYQVTPPARTQGSP